MERGKKRGEEGEREERMEKARKRGLQERRRNLET